MFGWLGGLIASLFGAIWRGLLAGVEIRMQQMVATAFA